MVCLAFSCLAVVVRRPGGGGYRHLPFADASRLPFERYARPFGGCATFDSSDEARERPLQPRLLCRYAFWPGFRQWFACCCPDFRSWPCSCLLHRYLRPLPYYLLPEDYVRLHFRICFQPFPPRRQEAGSHLLLRLLHFRVPFQLDRRLHPGD